MREKRRIQAKKMCNTYLFDKETKMSHCPHTEFAISIEENLSIFNNKDTGSMEYFCQTEGRWFSQGGGSSLKGEEIAELLIATFSPVRLCYVQVDGKTKLVPMPAPWDDSKLRNGPFLNPIVDMVKSLKLVTTVPLDSGLACKKVRNFRGAYCLDFNVPAPPVDWADDASILAALELPIRKSVKEDRISRTVPKEFQEYDSDHKVSLARLINKTCLWLGSNDALSDELKQEWDNELKHHTGLRKVFYEAHNCHDDSVFQQRIIFENACGKAQGRMEVSTFFDEGDGSTGKGTCRKYVEEACGTYTGKEQRGYVAVMTHHALAPDKGGGEKPREQWANLDGCIFALVDDFKATDKLPLCNASMRQISGGNGVTAARKGQSEKVFDFDGLLILLVNGLWVGDEPILGSDMRRYTGSNFQVCYKNAPEGPNERAKDRHFKPNLHKLVPEFWFVARCYWLAHTPYHEADITLPRPSSTMCLIDALSKKCSAVIDTTCVKKFIVEKLTTWVLGPAKPASCTEIVSSFASYIFSQTGALPGDADARSALGKVLQYKAGFPVPRHLQRPKTTVNAYVTLVDGNSMALTLKPEGLVCVVFARPTLGSSQASRRTRSWPRSSRSLTSPRPMPTLPWLFLFLFKRKKRRCI